MKNFKFRKLKMDCSKELFPLLNDLDIKRFLPGLYCENLEKVNEKLKYFNLYENEFFEILDSNDNIVGILAYEHIDIESLEISFFISKEFRNRHYSSQSLKEFLLEIPTTHPFVKNVYFFINEKNVKSKKAVESIGANYSHTFEDEELVYKKTILPNSENEQSL